MLFRSRLLPLSHPVASNRSSVSRDQETGRAPDATNFEVAQSTFGSRKSPEPETLFQSPATKPKSLPKRGFREWPTVLGGSALLLLASLGTKVLGAATVVGIPLIWPVSLIVDVAALQSIAEAWKKRQAPWLPASKTPLDTLKAYGYVHPAIQEHRQLLETHSQSLAQQERTHPLLQALQSHYQQLDTLVQETVNPKQPTELILSRKELEKRLKMPHGLRSPWDQQLLHPNRWIAEWFQGGGKATLQDLHRLNECFVKQLQQSPEGKGQWIRLEQALAHQYGRTLTPLLPEAT
jgi:hypothetical protein